MKNLNKSRKIVSSVKRTAITVVLWLLLPLLLTSAAHSFEYDDIIKIFEKDSGRSNPIELVERFKTIISQITNMEFKNDIVIKFESIGALKKRMFDQTLGKLYDDVESEIAGEEFLLKRFHLLNPETDYYEFIQDAMFMNVYGMYLPDKKELLLMKGTNKNFLPATLLHELIHAAQDSYVDLDKMYNENFKDEDSYIATSALVEGQAGMAQVLINVKKDLQDKSTGEILEKIKTDLEQRLANLEDTKYTKNAELNEFFVRLRVFPYTYGLLFTLKLYLNENKKDFVEMFEKMPVSTEQILHFDKYQNNEGPAKTILQGKNKLFQDETQELYTSTLGEYFILTSFDMTLKKGNALNRKASEGWGGDYIRVFRSNGSMFLVWDTLWDTEDDAVEFFDRYKEFAKKRLNTTTFSSQGLFDAVYPDKGPQFFIKRIGNRVLIIEGKVKSNKANTIIRNITTQIN